MGQTFLGDFKSKTTYWFEINENILVIIEGEDCLVCGRVKQYYEVS
jgi:hypothetical protein